MVLGANPVVFGSKCSDLLGTYSGYLGYCIGIWGRYLVFKKNPVVFMVIIMVLWGADTVEFRENTGTFGVNALGCPYLHTFSS